MHRAFQFICSHLVWLWVNPPFIFSFYPPPCLSLSVPFPPFIGKTVCERSIKGTRVSCILMKWDVKYKWTGHRQRQKENETRRWKVTDEEEEWQRSLMFGGDSVFIKPKGDIKFLWYVCFFSTYCSSLTQLSISPNSTPSPLQSESHFGSNMHRTLRWDLSLTPSTQWHMACITCNGHSAQVTR